MKDEYEERDRQRGVTGFFTVEDCDCSNISKYDPQTGEYRDVKAITPGKANRLLAERGTVVYGYAGPDHCWGTTIHDGAHPDTHQALLVCIEKIEKPDTAESILKDLVASQSDADGQQRLWGIVERARRLIKDEK